MVSVIKLLRSSSKYIWSIYRQYGHNTFEIESYYMVNNRIIRLHI